MKFDKNAIYNNNIVISVKIILLIVNTLPCPPQYTNKNDLIFN